jgi:hypothetical protein
MDRRGRPTNPAWALHGRLLLLLLPPGVAAELPGLLHWFGWAHLDGVLHEHKAGRQAAAPTRQLRSGSGRGDASASGEPLARLIGTCADACARL